MTWILVLFLIAIVISLGVGLYYLMKEGGTRSKNVFVALSWRVGLQAALVIFLAVAYFAGWIQPHSDPINAAAEHKASQQQEAPERSNSP